MDEINQIWSHWKTVEVIGQGGFGTVYKVQRETFDKVSYGAVKVIRIPSDQSEVDEMTTSGLNQESIKNYYKDMVYQLLDEIKTMERFKSASHIVNIEDYEIIENKDGIGWTIYIRMELLTNLNKYLKDHPMGLMDVAKLGVHISRALEYCQQNKIIHRDIKPGNIFVSEFGEFKLGDFGISREVEKTNATLSQKGTKSYMAPEMVRMEKYGRTVDLYALGLTMYEILNHGRMPFLPPFPEPFYPKDREEAMLKRLTGAEFPNPVDGDDKMSYILNKACKSIASERYQTATEMKEDLQAYIDGLPLPSLQTNVKVEKEKVVVPPIIVNEEKTMNGFNDEQTVGSFTNTIFDEDKTIGSQTTLPMFEDEQTVGTNSFIPTDVTEELEEEDKPEVVPPKKSNKLPMIAIAALLVIGIGVGAFALGSSNKNDPPPTGGNEIVNNDVQDKEENEQEDKEEMKQDEEENKQEEETKQDEPTSSSSSSSSKPSSSGSSSSSSSKPSSSGSSSSSSSKPSSSGSSSSSSSSSSGSSSGPSSNSGSSSGSSSNSGSSSTPTVVKKWSAWATSLPSNVTSAEYEIEEQVRYSFRDKETTTSTQSSLSGWTQDGSVTTYGDYGSWSSWSTTAVSSSETRQIESKTVTDKAAYTQYRYWRYHLKGGSRIHWCEKLGKNYWGGTWYKEYTDWSTTKKTDQGSAGNCSCHSGMRKYGSGSKDFYYWQETRTVPAVTHEEYRYRDRSKTVTYSYFKWSDWSGYTTSKVTNSDTREVKTQTYYRYKLK